MPDADASPTNPDAGPDWRGAVATLNAREPSVIIAAAIFQLAILAWLILGRTL
jgi:hypothetical protein